MSNKWIVFKDILDTPIDFGSLVLKCKNLDTDEEHQTTYYEFSSAVLDWAKKHGKHFLKKPQSLLDGEYVKVGNKRYKIIGYKNELES